MNVHSVRTHDISLQNPGLMIGDTDMIFPLFHADVNDPRNYIFKPTDDYLKVSTKEGAKIVFRLGVSIDHSKNKYRTWMPEPKKWAEICCNIIAHYNEGWANGYKMGIEYWEIWNEPGVKSADGNLMWAGDLKQFNDFYCEVAKIIKKRFPNIKIGGPAHVSMAGKQRTYDFLKRASETGAPVDFYSWHYYGKDLKYLKDQVSIVRKWADDLGFKNTELHLNEWHYLPMSWADLRGKNANKKDIMYGLEAGVFASSMMTLWQDAPLDVANYYTFQGGWGMLNKGEVFKSYYVFKAFGELVRYPNRLETTTPDPLNASVLAGRNVKGKTAIMVNLFKQGQCNVVVDLKNCTFDLTKAQVLICDDDKNLEPADNVKIHSSKIEIPVKSDSACILIKL